MREFDPRVSALVRRVLGEDFDALLATANDLRVPPIFLQLDRRPRLVRVRDRAVKTLEAWADEHPAEARTIYALLPTMLQLDGFALPMVQAALWEDYFLLSAASFAFGDAGSPVLQLLPELGQRMDDDGLLFLDGLDAVPHGIFAGPLSLHYHPFLHRGFSSNVNYELTGVVLRLCRSGTVIGRIAIDEWRTRSREEHQAIEERDYWYGPRLCEAALDDPLVDGVTVHGDPEYGESILSPYSAISVRWAVERGASIKSVEVEELVPVNDTESGLVLARYLHARRDMKTHTFVHCDGAVKGYEKVTYPTTVEDFKTRGRAPHYRKVFRLDGEITASAWSALTSFWFRGNRLILEYLSGLAEAPVVS
jgi:hypothetical protein